MKKILNIVMNIKVIDVAIAAPAIPYVGINRILRNVFITTDIKDILNKMLTLPILARVLLTDIIGIYMK